MQFRIIAAIVTAVALAASPSISDEDGQYPTDDGVRVRAQELDAVAITPIEISGVNVKHLTPTPYVVVSMKFHMPALPAEIWWETGLTHVILLHTDDRGEIVNEVALCVSTSWRDVDHSIPGAGGVLRTHLGASPATRETARAVAATEGKVVAIILANHAPC